ncbi:MAG: L-rhamnose/proton symporter RhaT [Pirellulaceae bacterium]
MIDNPFMGVGFHAAGGVAHGSFYVPLKRVQAWAWESAWLTQGIAAWGLMPLLVAWLTGTRPAAALAAAPWSAIGLAFGFGAMWGCGSLTFGLSMRYLGMSLGQAVALGYTVSLGTLVPPLLKGELMTLAGGWGGRLVLLGVLVCLGGIGLCGLAGWRRERECTARTAGDGRKSLALGFAVATFSGIMSAGFAFGIQAGRPIAEAARDQGAPEIFVNGPVFVMVMAGGLAVNLLWCLYLGLRNGTFGDYVGRASSRPVDWTGSPSRPSHSGVLWRNYGWASLSGATWYVGFMLYGIGSTCMGRYDFTSWSIHLAFVIVFSTLCGILAREWQGVSQRTSLLVGLALLVLVGSTFVIAIGNRLATSTREEPSLSISRHGITHDESLVCPVTLGGGTVARDMFADAGRHDRAAGFALRIPSESARD